MPNRNKLVARTAAARLKLSRRVSGTRLSCSLIVTSVLLLPYLFNPNHLLCLTLEVVICRGCISANDDHLGGGILPMLREGKLLKLEQGSSLLVCVGSKLEPLRLYASSSSSRPFEFHSQSSCLGTFTRKTSTARGKQQIGE